MRTPPQILIVDDNPANRDIFETRLATQGYDIITARDGEEGLAAALEHQPDLILLDVMMPKMDGIEVCRRLKGEPPQARSSRAMAQRYPVLVLPRPGSSTGQRVSSANSLFDVFSSFSM